MPPDADGDLVSNLNDPDDDNDGLLDTSDPFAIDAANGTTTSMPVSYTWENDAPNPGGLLFLGFTGLMTNFVNDYESLFDPTALTAGGAAGVLTVDAVPAGDAKDALNTQEYAFQFGFNASLISPVFTMHTSVVAPFVGLIPEDFQSMGLFFGNGDQDNYIKLHLTANGGLGGIEFVIEQDGVSSVLDQQTLPMPGPDFVDLYIEVDPATLTATASYAVTTGGVNGPRIDLNAMAAVPASWLSGDTAPAVGVISTSNGASTPFPATWDFLEVVPDFGSGSLPPAAFVAITPGSGINASTFTNGSIQFTNDSLGGQIIERINIDLSSSIFPDMVFDPDGVAGDVVAKGFTPNSGATNTGLLGHSLLVPHDDGFDQLEITFNDFDPGEQFTFSIDVDPTSIRGVSAPGPNESGSVVGLELVGSEITIDFDEGSKIVLEPYAELGSAGGAVNTGKATPSAPLVIEIVGVLSVPAVVSNPNQTVRVSGPIGSEVLVLIVEGGLFTDGVPGGGFDLDPFEANSALIKTEHSATITASGFVDVPIVLTKSDPNAGLNHIIAVPLDPDGSTGPKSTTIVLELQ